MGGWVAWGGGLLALGNHWSQRRILLGGNLLPAARGGSEVCYLQDREEAHPQRPASEGFG